MIAFAVIFAVLVLVALLVKPVKKSPRDAESTVSTKYLQSELDKLQREVDRLRVDVKLARRATDPAYDALCKIDDEKSRLASEQLARRFDQLTKEAARGVMTQPDRIR